MKEDLQPLRDFFDTGTTRNYLFRKEQLRRLRDAIVSHEKELLAALDADLGKNPEESWVTEIGFVLAEIRHALKHLKKWMAPQRVPTNLMNFPSRSFIYQEPLGVVLVIGAWNYPVHLLLTPVIGAIAAGNSVVIKPSEFAPATAAVIKKLLSENFSRGYILFVEGEGAKVVPAMMDAFRFDHIFYTGSTHVGREIYQAAARQLIPVTLELGGKSPCVVEEDANIRVAARRIAVAKFSNAGQMCVAPDYVLVHESVKEQLVTALKQVILGFFSGDAARSYDYGKIINARQFYRLQMYLEHGRIVFGGRHDAATLHIEPTLLEDVPLHAAVMGEEIFGPVLPIITFRTFEEAASIVNRNPNPLALYVFTESSAREARWIRDVPFGGGCINNTSWHLTNFNLPFGGRGNSGFGVYHGKFSFEVFSHRKAIMKTPTWFDPNVKYPPFKGKLSLIRKLVR
ncbi:MAG TPA: aldehyde dehydrogenase [Flavisolibacter sp.]